MSERKRKIERERERGGIRDRKIYRERERGKVIERLTERG